MEAIAVALLSILVGGPIAYVLGTRRARFERLYEKRAEVMARLSELLYLMSRKALAWTSPVQAADTDRQAQGKEASEAFDEFIAYYGSNSIWLEPETCERIESFIRTVRNSLVEYADDLNEEGHPGSRAGREASLRIAKEIPALRRELEEAFRAILYPRRWRSPLRVLARREGRNAERLDAPADQE